MNILGGLFVKIRDAVAGSNQLKRKEKLLKRKIQESQDEDERRILKRKWKGLRLTRQRKERQATLILGSLIGLLVISLISTGVWKIVIVHREKVAAEEQAAREEAERIAREKKEEEERIARENAPVEITLSFTGDCTLGTDESFDEDTSFNSYYEYYGKDYFFEKVKSIFEKDDITIINMEGTLTNSTEREDKQFAFKGWKEFSGILTSGSVEAANMANNHSHDYGEQSFTDTIEELKSKGIETFGYDDVAIIETKGIKVGLFGIYELKDHLERKDQVTNNIQKLKDQGANVIVAVFHWGNELVTSPDSNQVMLAHHAIDQGADVVVGHHPHVLQGIEEYKGKTIAYSLGNFCFGGNLTPREYATMIFQKKFTFVKGELVDSESNIIPCRSSSEYYINNYQPIVVEGEEAEQVLQIIKDRL